MAPFRYGWRHRWQRRRSPADPWTRLAAVLCIGLCGLSAPAPAEEAPALEVASPALMEQLPPGARRDAPAEPVLAEYGASWLEHSLDGSSVEYTLDPELELAIRRQLLERDADLAHVILMDTRTGNLLAFVSTDPETLPAARAYPTASLMKIVTAAAVLRTAPELARRSCGYVGSPWELPLDGLEEAPDDARRHSFSRALALSNNQCFGRYAVRDLGSEALLQEIETVGFLEAAAGHPAGELVAPRSRLALAHLGSGMAGSYVTPLGAVRLAAALATGELVTPRWIARVRDAEGDPLALPPREASRRVWSEELSADLRGLLVDVTEQGTARRGFFRANGERRLGPVRVAGKTGSLSGTDPAGKYQWFVGVAPAEAPRVAIATLSVSTDGRAPAPASRLAADALQQVFCEGGRCAASRAETLLARADGRDAQAGVERAAHARELRLAVARARAFETAAAHEIVELDRPPRPIDAAGFRFPARLRGRPAEGEIVLRLRISERGRVLAVKVDASDLPEHLPYVVSQVRRWRFTPPLRNGEPTRATARLPIQIDIEQGS